MKLNNPLIKLFYTYEELEMVKSNFENPLRRQLRLKNNH